MLKAIATINDRKVLFVGLSFNNLDKLRAEPRDTFIRIDGKTMDLPMDVMVFSGESEAHLAHLFRNAIGPDTVVHVDKKLKS